MDSLSGTKEEDGESMKNGLFHFTPSTTILAEGENESITLESCDYMQSVEGKKYISIGGTLVECRLVGKQAQLTISKTPIPAVIYLSPVTTPAYLKPKINATIVGTYTNGMGEEDNAENGISENLNFTETQATFNYKDLKFSGDWSVNENMILTITSGKTIRKFSIVRLNNYLIVLRDYPKAGNTDYLFYKNLPEKDYTDVDSAAAIDSVYDYGYENPYTADYLAKGTYRFIGQSTASGGVETAGYKNDMQITVTEDGNFTLQMGKKKIKGTVVKSPDRSQYSFSSKKWTQLAEVNVKYDIDILNPQDENSESKARYLILTTILPGEKVAHDYILAPVGFDPFSKINAQE